MLTSWIVCARAQAVYSRFSAKQEDALAAAAANARAAVELDEGSPATFPAEGAAPAEDDSLRQHFMATGNFGTAVMALTIFSTAFSG